MSNAFKETKNLFIDYTNYSRPLSYAEWLSVPDDNKAAILYVQFYEQITLAWFKTKSFFVLEEDGVSTMLQYLVKNVPIIKENPKRFTPAYIYKVAYNCLYCISHDIKRDIARWENETSNIVTSGDGDELDLFDTVVIGDGFDESMTRGDFWAIIEMMGPETEKVINHLLNGESLDAVNKLAKSYKDDPLRDVSVTLDQMEVIMEQLRTNLAAFRKIYNV